MHVPFNQFQYWDEILSVVPSDLHRAHRHTDRIKGSPVNKIDRRAFRAARAFLRIFRYQMASRKKILLKVCNLSGEMPFGILIGAYPVLQVIILGDSGVGKTSLMNQYVRAHLVNGGRLHTYSWYCLLGQQEI